MPSHTLAHRTDDELTGSDPKMKGIGARFEADVQKCIAAVDFAKKGAKAATPLAQHEALCCPGVLPAGAAVSQLSRA